MSFQAVFVQSTGSAPSQGHEYAVLLNYLHQLLNRLSFMYLKLKHVFKFVKVVQTKHIIFSSLNGALSLREFYFNKLCGPFVWIIKFRKKIHAEWMILPAIAEPTRQCKTGFVELKDTIHGCLFAIF